LIAVGILQLAILFVTLARAKGLAIVLGPEGLGVVGTIDQLLITLAQISALGIPYTAMKFMSAAHSRSQDAYRLEFAIFGRLMLILAFLAGTAGMVVLLFDPDWLGKETVQYRDAMFIAVFGVPALMLTFFLPQALAAGQKPSSAAIFNLLMQAFLATAALLGAITSGIYGLYVATTATGLIFIVLSLIIFSRFYGLSVLRKKTVPRSEDSTKPMIVRMAFAAYSSLVSFAVCMLVIRYTVLVTVGEADTGFLHAALAVALSVGSILATMNNLYLAPELNRAIPVEEKFSKANSFGGLIALLLLVAAVPVALFPGLTLTILYTGEFLPAATALILCIVWQGLYQLAGVYLQLLIGLNHLRFAAFSTVLGFLISGILAVAFVDQFGILIAPLALIAGTLVSTFLSISLLVVASGMAIPWAVLFKFFLAAAILGAGTLFSVSSELTISGAAARAVFSGVAILIAWRLHASDPVLKLPFGGRMP